MPSMESPDIVSRKQLESWGLERVEAYVNADKEVQLMYGVC